MDGIKRSDWKLMNDLPMDGIGHHVDRLEVHRDAKSFVRTLQNVGIWKGIVAVTRGGLVPAAIIDREMVIRFVDTFVHEVPQNHWVFFPWDMEPQFIEPMAKSPTA